MPIKIGAITAKTQIAPKITKYFGAISKQCNFADGNNLNYLM